jgi:hypothetical protein
VKLSHVYHHLRASDLQLFYIGKGTFRRANSAFSRNPEWRQVVEKHGFITVIVATYQNESDAYQEEARQIQLAKEMGIQLVNRAPGIPKFAGVLVETRKRMSESAKRRVNPLLGLQSGVPALLRQSWVRDTRPVLKCNYLENRLSTAVPTEINLLVRSILLLQSCVYLDLSTV